jgi:hypothetical protein
MREQHSVNEAPNNNEAIWDYRHGIRRGMKRAKTSKDTKRGRSN